jgi:hypothetical protein
MNYHRFCIWDAQPVPEARLRRNSNTCSPECQKAERKAKRAYYGALRKEYYTRPLKAKLERLGVLRVAQCG